MPVLLDPSEDLRSAFLEMAVEFAFHGEGKYMRQAENFSGFLTKRSEDAQERGLPGHVPESQFWLVDAGRIVGCSRLRHRLTPELEHEGGHIGYDIRPTMRKRGFGTTLLGLTVARAAAMGLARVRLTCDVDNLASIRVIEKNGGVLDAVVSSRRRPVMIRQYWLATGA